MKRSYQALLLLIFIVSSFAAHAQGVVQNVMQEQDETAPSMTHCGSFEYLQQLDNQHEGVLDASDQFILGLKKVMKNKGRAKTNTIYQIPVVFHVVHNEEAENLSDEVINNQLDILNACFRRTNADAIDTRPEFLSSVGDTQIEFFLAEEDPNGESTSGIVRTETSVEHFGGILPYALNQSAEIGQWVNDSLFYNLFRITQSNLGGSDPWDTDRYLNIWVGDLRIFEPEIDNFEELVYFGLATPPVDHYNWPPALVEQVSGFSQGVLMHYVSIGDNNPNSYPAPYQAFNNSVSSGKLLVHEAGHYLGLRHIWGDGNCSMDDFIDDTPLANAPGQYNCNFLTNSCVDDFDGADLPNMVENYMDYTSGQCQNAFTIGQIELMQEVLIQYRPLLPEIFLSNEELDQNNSSSKPRCYPNPAKEALTIEWQLGSVSPMEIQLFNALGKEMTIPEGKQKSIGEHSLTLYLDFLPSGIYYININKAGLTDVQRIVKL